ncbi:hypothetical protein [Selenomonas ruminis]|uniref:Uncharacterized protein n=1 Tax=Selenomonas ruminis TaxID=2593411 RepID=A0A5D6W9U2_9FIRM|nr:hypothetical protein [Selenomonas sp. mPRGC5]TYZ25063.1 hypothetical protein FZ040_03285 [Selenomonas sp. mPRGC5]
MAFRGLVAMCNLLLGASNVLKNRYLHVDWQAETAHSLKKQHIEQHIESNNSLLVLLKTVKGTERTKNNIVALYEAFGREKIFSRSDVLSVLSITERPATTLFKKMLEAKLIESVHGLGKGKYRFVVKER